MRRSLRSISLSLEASYWFIGIVKLDIGLQTSGFPG